MENNIDSKIGSHTREYIINQGNSIARLHHLLRSNFLMHQLRTGISYLLQAVLYLVVAASFPIAYLIPNKIGWSFLVGNDAALEDAFTNPEVKDGLMLLSFILMVLALPVLALAIMIGRNRRKRRVISKAFGITEQMKADLEEAVNRFGV